MPTLDFKGKQHIYAHHLSVPYRPLIPDASKSIHPPPICDTNVLKTERAYSSLPDSNLIIHGDNLHALKALLPTYAGRVKCIYIDPPYNTGKEGWIYNDRVNSPLMRQWLADNKPVDGEDLERHDKWLCMMWPRLHLLRELLAEDGVIFVSIDDNEQHHLRAIMDEIFGEENLVGCIPWESGAPKNDTDISIQHEYILAYAKTRRRNNRRLKRTNIKTWFQESSFAVFPDELSMDGFSNPDNDPRGAWKLQTFHAPNIRPNLTYPIINPETKQEFWPPEGRCWRMEEKHYRRNFQDNRILFGRRGTSMPQLKVFHEEVKVFGVTPQSWFTRSIGDNAEGTSDFKRIFSPSVKFDHPKPKRMIQRLLKMASRSDDIVLDSFAGSGTTAHAVLALNKEDGGNRRFILVECEDYADAITAERVWRVINGVPTARDSVLREGLGGEFTYCTLGEPISIETMLNGENLPGYASLATYLLHCATGIAANPSHLAANAALSDDTGFFYESDHVRYHLLYRSDIEWLRGEKGALNSTRAEAIAAAAKEADKSAVVFAPLRFVSQNDLSAMGVTFCQLPYELTASRAQALEV